MSKFRSVTFLAILPFVFFSVVLCEKSTFDEDLRVTSSQKAAFDKFKATVLQILPHEYMKEDIYLIKWLRAKNFDVNQAEEFLKQNLKWRIENNMDSIHEENIDAIGCTGCIRVDTYDKNGAPVITAVTDILDFRKASETGQEKKWTRLLLQSFEVASLKLREARKEGKHVSRFQLLINMERFSLAKHGCPRCLAGIVNFIHSYENHYPGMVDKLVIFNAPSTIQALRPVVRGAWSGRTRSHITLIGQDKQAWSKFLLDFIDASQLPRDFGGTRVQT